MPPSDQAGRYRHVVGLRAVRQFRTTAIPDDELVAILEAGRWTVAQGIVKPGHSSS